ncbi:polyribonucleotide nucleotidyltransferase [Stomatohabitans albus]|uniref:polyribonucleotide nucleotidyltransferase n=1 Tax=Stomatohabitans albus TaxID=3110766 RepID=UPI00300C459A
MSKLGKHVVNGTVGNAEIVFETGKVAGQAHGAVIAHLGGSTLLVTATASRDVRPGTDFFPLTVDFEERMYAAGKIPGSFFKREGKASEQAILTCRLVDRPMRPTFVEGLRNEVQIIMTSLAADQVNPLDVLGINGASAACMVAGLPFHGPVAGLRMGMDRDGRWTPFPTYQWMTEEGVFDLVVAGRLNKESGEIDILMVEAEATPNATQMVEMGATKPTEEVLGKALEEAKGYLKTLCDLQLEFVDKAGVNDHDLPISIDYTDEVYKAVERAAKKGLKKLYADEDMAKAERSEAVAELKEAALDEAFDVVTEDMTDEELERQALNAFKHLEKATIRRRIVKDGVRIDGRSATDIRPLAAEVGVLDRAHGSGLFTRGETQVLNIATLGMAREAQRIDTINPEEERTYIHHYNFPPYSVGETGFMRGPKRREIGHGALAERALVPVLPSTEDFPYTIRLVSEVLSSNGSTSMASVCGSTLSLMDAGVPIAAPVAGIAMGLIHEDGDYVTLTDIQGAEDAFGDMDFKVAGTADFVTALQLDTKLTGIPAHVLGNALTQAREARLEILDVMASAIKEPRPEVNPNAPRVHVEFIPADKIGEVIGPKGKIIREISDETGAQIDIEDENGRGVVRIYATDGAAADAALARVRQIANPVVPQVGERYFGTVVNTVDFGAFVSLTPGTDGLLHISKLGGSKRLSHADEAVDIGEKLWVEVTEVKNGGKYSLTLIDPEASSDVDPVVTPANEEPVARKTDRDDEKPARTKVTEDDDDEAPVRRARRRNTDDDQEKPRRARRRASSDDEDDTSVRRPRRRRSAGDDEEDAPVRRVRRRTRSAE